MDDGRNPLFKKLDLQGAGGKHTYYPSPELSSELPQRARTGKQLRNIGDTFSDKSEGLLHILRRTLWRAEAGRTGLSLYLATVTFSLLCLLSYQKWNTEFRSQFLDSWRHETMAVGNISLLLGNRSSRTRPCKTT